MIMDLGRLLKQQQRIATGKDLANDNNFIGSDEVLVCQMCQLNDYTVQIFVEWFTTTLKF